MLALHFVFSYTHRLAQSTPHHFLTSLFPIDVNKRPAHYDFQTYMNGKQKINQIHFSDHQ